MKNLKTLVFIAVLSSLATLLIFMEKPNDNTLPPLPPKAKIGPKINLKTNLATNKQQCNKINLEDKRTQVFNFFKERIKLLNKADTSIFDLISVRLKLNPFKIRELIGFHKEEVIQQNITFNELRFLYKTFSDKGIEIVNAVKKGEIKKDLYFNSQSNSYSLVGLILKEEYLNDSSLIPELLNEGVKPTLDDIILSIKKKKNLLTLKIIQYSDYDFDHIYFRGRVYRSFLTDSIYYKNEKLTQNLLQESYQVTPDTLGYTALDYAIIKYNDINIENFKKKFKKLLSKPLFNSRISHEYLKKHFKMDNTPYYRETLTSNIDNKSKIIINKFIYDITFDVIRHLKLSNITECLEVYKKDIESQLGEIINDHLSNEMRNEKHNTFYEIERNAALQKKSPESIININNSLNEKLAVENYRKYKIKSKAEALRLKNKKIDSNSKIESEFTSITELILKKKWQAVRVEISRLNNILEGEKLVYIYALLIQNNSPHSLISYLFNSGVKPTEELTLLIVSKNNTDLIKLFESFGVTFTKGDILGYTPMMNAIKIGAFNSFKYLINKYGAEQSNLGLDLLDLALFNLYQLNQIESSNYRFPYITEIFSVGVNVEGSHIELTKQLRTKNLLLYFSLVESFPELIESN